MAKQSALHSSNVTPSAEDSRCSVSVGYMCWSPQTVGRGAEEDVVLLLLLLEEEVAVAEVVDGANEEEDEDDGMKEDDVVGTDEVEVGGCPYALVNLDEVGVERELCENGRFAEQSSGDEVVVRVERSDFDSVLRAFAMQKRSAEKK